MSAAAIVRRVNNAVFCLAAAGTAAKFCGNLPADVPSAAKHEDVSFLMLNKPEIIRYVFFAWPTLENRRIRSSLTIPTSMVSFVIRLRMKW